MGSCGGLIFNRHKWFKFDGPIPEQTQGYYSPPNSYRVCRKCGTLQLWYLGYEMDSGVEWLDRGTLPDYQKIIDHHEAEEQKERDQAHIVETAVHCASEFIPKLGNKTEEA